jgi:hypothetical protein
MTKTLIKIALLVPMLAADLASTASANGHYSHAYGYGHKHVGYKQDGHVKAFGWYKPVQVIKIVPAYKTCSVWSYHGNICWKWY